MSVDHIVAYRLLVEWAKKDASVDPNHLTNLISLCRACHQKKTAGIETMLLKGDIVGFRTAINALVSIDRVDAALRLYKLI